MQLTTTLPDLSALIRPGDGIIWGQATAEPTTLVAAVLAQRALFSQAQVFLGVNFAGLTLPEHADHLLFSSYCGAGANRALADAGVLDIFPLPYSLLGQAITRGQIKADVVMLQVAPPNAQGEYSIGLSTEYLIPALAKARVVIAEVNPRLPWVHTEKRLRREDFALLIDTNTDPIALPYGAPGDIERRIARNAAQFVPDGATLEFGLGSLPIAVLESLDDRRDLGIHSGIVCDTVAQLTEAGVITNALKEIDRGVSVGGILFGTANLYRWAHNNAALRLMSSDYTHSPRILGQLHRFVAINSAVEVDLTGQVNAEIIQDKSGRASYAGAVGGALDFIRAANHSPGGCSIIALPASIGGKISRIVHQINAPVATPRSEAGVFVTEWGVADLRGLSLNARIPKMIAIAHPDLRESLERAAKASGWSGSA